MKMVCIGDSLTYGLGIPVNENWAALLGRELGFEVVNKGVNGDTSGGMLARLERDVLLPSISGMQWRRTATL